MGFAKSAIKIFQLLEHRWRSAANQNTYLDGGFFRHPDILVCSSCTGVRYLNGPFLHVVTKKSKPK
jgi:hypothetical protein